jgi:hypothetical protein
MSTPKIRGLGIVQDGFTMRWKATGEVKEVGWLEAWGATLVEATQALQAQAERRIAKREEETSQA